MSALKHLKQAFHARPMDRPIKLSGWCSAEQGEILKNWSAPFPGYFIAYPQQRQMAPSLRAFIDFMKSS
jgi:DNA-binding transcriptional LysR family regulator